MSEQKSEIPRGKKIMRRALGGMVLAVVIVAILGVLFGEKGIKALIERHASQALGVPVKIASLTLNPVEKTVQINNIEVRNPGGFQQSNALTVGTVNIAAEQISSEKIVLGAVSVKQTDLYMEVTETGLNLRKLWQNLQTEEDAAQASTPKESADQSGTSGQGPRIVINQLRISEALIHPSSTLTDRQLEPVVMPDVDVRDIGAEQGGVSVETALNEILTPLIRTALEKGAQAGFLNGLAAERLKDLRSRFDLSRVFVNEVEGAIKKGVEKSREKLQKFLGGEKN